MDAVKILQYVMAAQAAYQLALEVAADARSLLNEKDQATLKEGLAKIQAENDAGHERLQDKLAG